MSATPPAAAKPRPLSAATPPHARPTRGGDAARYRGRHGTKRVAKAVLIGAIPPLMLKTATNPLGTPIEAFDQIRAAVAGDRSSFWKELSMPFYGFNRPGAKISEGVRESFWLQS